MLQYSISLNYGEKISFITFFPVFAYIWANANAYFDTHSETTLDMGRGTPLPIHYPHILSAQGASILAPSALDLAPPNPIPGSGPVQRLSNFLDTHNYPTNA